mgnify:CR=1 FL=1
MGKGNNRELARQYLVNFPGYLKWGASKLAEKLDVSHADIVDIKTELRLNDKPFRRLFFDIETSYNIAKVWRTGWKLNIGPHQIIQERKVISVSWKWHDEDKVHNLAWDKDQCDKSMLISFNKVLEQADEVIGHNSDRFDIPWLRTRCLYHRIPFRTYIKSFDTLKKVKSAFNFQSNKLDYIASFLGFGHKLPTNMALWDRIILNKEPEALKEMVEYCDHDVVLLEDVYNEIIAYVKPVTHVGVAEGGNKCSCPNCGSGDTKLLDNQFTALGTIRRHVGCNDCDSDFIVSNTAWTKA